MYEMNIRVRYSETDREHRVRLHHLLDYFQDIATFHSMSFGLYGPGTPSEDVWYLLCWDVKISRYPLLGERLRLVTDPYKMKGFYGYRRFSIYDEKDEEIVSADSIWLLMDAEKMIPRRISKELTDTYVDPGSDQTVTIKRKLPDKGRWEPARTIEVTDLFLDYNKHVNNAFYVQWARMLLPDRIEVSRLKVDYRQSAVSGDILQMDTYRQEGLCRVRFRNQEDLLIAMVDMYL